MLLSIYDSNGIKKAEIAADDSSTQVKEIQGDNVLTLSFTHYEHIVLDVNDSCLFESERYWLMERYAPKQKSDGEWKYDLKLYGIESLIKRFLVLETTDGDAEPVFRLTATPREHVSMIVKCINDGMNHSTEWKVGQVDGTDLIVIDYEGKYCDEALKEIAQKVGGKAEWWVDGQTVNVCRCEHGEEVTLAYGKGLTDLERDTSNTAKFYTRLFPIGSSRNIDPAKYGHSRLMLPGGKKYVEFGTDEYGIHDHYESTAFSGIYPRRLGTVSSVRSEDVKDENGNLFTIYYFKDSGMNFDPNDYELAGETKRVSFQNGDLAGLGSSDDHYFDVNFDSETREFEIITIWPSDDMQLPGGLLVPKVGDRYILWNIRMPDEYYPMAEAEFQEAVDAYNAEHWQDISVYKAPTDHVWIEDNGVSLFVGLRVRLESEKYFPETGFRQSRITKITRKVNLPSQMNLEISDALQQGSMDRMNDSIGDLKDYTRSKVEGVSLPDIVKTGDSTKLTDTNLLSALRVLREISQRALSRLNDDEAKGLIKFLAGLETGTYKEGVSGAKIDASGKAEFGELVTRLKAILAELQVNGAAEFRDQLSSEDFVSGFVGGKGWAILKREVLNALGVPETKYTAEFDDIVVRGALRVFTMVVSQLLGENDNRIFTGMMEVDHYDEATGRVYLQTSDGKFYNPFRRDDYIMVQQYNGLPSSDNDHYITKHYEFIVMDAGCGDESEGESRLDWITFRNFLSADGRDAGAVISKGDTFARVDNATDADRKGLIQIITVGTATPYMDIVYGMKTDPDGYLKGRLGNLTGIHHHLFGWLEGFGELLTNLYAVGDFRLRRTGESVDAQLEMLKGMFATRYQTLTYDMTEEDNYLYNATFTELLDGWQVNDDGTIITSNGNALLMNGNTYIADGKIAGIEQLDGRTVLHLKKSGIKQLNSRIRKPGTHKEYIDPAPNELSGQYIDVKDTLYLSVRFLAKTAGTLTIGMSGSTPEVGSFQTPIVVAVTSSMEWQTLQWSGTWDGKGDFVLEYTGDMYVSLLSLTDKALDDFKKEVSTQIVQTASNIRLLGSNIDSLKGTVTQLGIDLDAANSRIDIYADRYNTLNGTVTQLGVRLDAAESKLSLYATKTDNLSETVTQLGIDLDAANSRIDIYADRYNTLNGTVTQLGVRLDAAESKLSLYATKTDNLSETVTQLGIDLDAVEGKLSVYATKEEVDSLGNRITTAEARIDVQSTQISMRVEKDGIISAINQSAESVSISASKINFNGMVTMNNSFRVEANGTTHIGGFVVSGSGLTNRNDDGTFTNDAYIIFRNDTTKCFAGIGGNVLPATSGVRGVARFENHDESDLWFLGANYAVLVSARGAKDNKAIYIDGGTVSGFAMQNSLVSTSKVIGRNEYNIVCINTSDITLTLPTMQLYDDGHVIRIKRLGSGSVKIALGYCYTYGSNGASQYKLPCLIYNQNSTLTGSNTLEISSPCDSMELVWCRDIIRTVNSTSYYGCWVQYKLPRDW